MSEMELDPGLLQDFITEATELLEEYTASLTSFEQDPQNIDTINPVFRAAHTLKGSSAFFGLTHIKDFAHKLENLLDDIRHQTRPADSKAIEYLFLAGNHLKAMFERLSAGDMKAELTPDEAAFQSDLVNWMGETGGGGTAGEGGADFEDACRLIKVLLNNAMEDPRDPADLIEDIIAVINPLPIELESVEQGGGGAEQSDPVAVAYKGVDLSEPALRALANIKSDDFDPKAYDADLKTLQTLAADHGWDEVKPLLDKAAEDFTAIYESGLDFDSVLLGLLRGKFQDFLAALDLTMPEVSPSAALIASGAEPESASYRGVDLSEPALRALANINGDKFDPKVYDADLKTLQALIDENGWDKLKALLFKAEDDFTAIYESGLDFDEVLLGLLRGKYQAFISALDLTFPESVSHPEEAQASEQAPAARADGNGGSKGGEAKSESKTMRISEEKVDGFMSYVGELIVTAETFNYLQKMIEQEKVNPNTVRAFKNANQAFRELSDELQESLMEIRRVPIKGILQKVNMMARELSHQLGKKVKVQLEGQDVQLDKSIAESLEAPLVHVVRNSLDHGLEPNEVRESQGKETEGLLRVSASADKEYFYMVVEDDGKGIDPEVMRTAAVGKGLMTEAQAAALTDKEAIGLIFGAGFSTAKAITDVSGRGVGMDVVRTNINALNGSISVDSTVGKGTTITLKIPLSVTLQVIKALHVRVGQANFIISLDEILESLRPLPEELSTVEGRGLVLNRRGQITPLIKLYEIFNLEPQYTNPVDGLVVMVETSAGRYALLVDAVMGQQQVVVKELGAQFKRLSFLSGSALLGDGGLGLVLDAGGVVNLAFGLGG